MTWSCIGQEPVSQSNSRDVDDVHGGIPEIPDFRVTPGSVDSEDRREDSELKPANQKSAILILRCDDAGVL